MKKKSHKRLTEFVFDMLSQTVNYFALEGSKVQVAQQAHDTDDEKDLEFVDVDGERDDPHMDDGFLANDDEAHYCEEPLFGVFGEHDLTAFNHFIDIRKSKAEAKFDDFDGYSYHRGSASKNEFEEYEFAGIGIKKIDEGINWWLNDEYVHVPGRKWYRDCSSSIPRYSFPADRGLYSTPTNEGVARFPLAESEGKENMGIPYSVFMPVDNMARYWYWNYKTNREHNPKDLGFVMHAIQDASVPHHAAGYCGNWHRKYEETVRDRLEGWIGNPTFQKGVRDLFEAWNTLDPSPPNALNVGDESLRSPCRNWRIEWLVTWIALNAYRAYVEAHQNFANGWKDNEASMKELTKKAAAMSMLALCEASILEMCYNFDPNQLEVKSLPLGRGWYVGVRLSTRGRLLQLEQFSTQEEANRCLEIIRHYRMNSRCTAGQMPYYLTDGREPRFGLRPLGGEQMADFNPDQIEVRSSGADWIIAKDNEVIINFRTLQSDAMRAYHVIQKYHFNRYCWLGARDNPSMQYFLQAPYEVVEGQPVSPGSEQPSEPPH